MQAFFERTQLPLTLTEDDIEEAFHEMTSSDLVYTVIALRKRSLQPLVLFSENTGTKRHGERIWAYEDLRCISMAMYFDAFHEGELDLNAEDYGPEESVFKSPAGDVRHLVRGNLSLQPANPSRKYCWMGYFAEKGRLLSELYPSKGYYDFYVRLSLGDRVLCTGFFEVSKDITILDEWACVDRGTIDLANADLSQWPEMQAFLKRAWLPWTVEVEEAFMELKPLDHVATVIALHKRSLKPFVFFSADKPTTSHLCGLGHNGVDDWPLSINSNMHFDVFHEGELDLNDMNNKLLWDEDPRQFIQGRLLLRPAKPAILRDGWSRFCSFDLNSPATLTMCFHDERI